MCKGPAVLGGWLWKKIKESSVAGIGCRRRTIGETGGLTGDSMK